MVALSKSILIGVGVIFFCLIMAAIGRGMGDTYAIFLLPISNDLGLARSEVASIYADKVIVTDDNPRGEDPEKIRNEILKGCPNAVSIANRREAICSGINGLRRNDFLIIAGKGHEQGQSFRDETVPFDDLLVAQNAIKNIEKGLSE